jgi:hypothetical protein
MACASSCKEQDHRSYGACLRSKNLAAVGLETTSPSFSTTRQKAFDKELDLYGSTVAQGIQPATTKTADIRKALDASDEHGRPYRADL